MAMIPAGTGSGQSDRNPADYQFPTGMYVVKLASVNEIGPSAKFPNGNRRLVFEFLVAEGQYAGKKTCIFVGLSLHHVPGTGKESKLIKLARSMGAKNPEQGFDPESLVGKTFQAMCESQPGMNGAEARTWVLSVIPQQGAAANGYTAPQNGQAAARGPAPRQPRTAQPQKKFFIDMGSGPEVMALTVEQIHGRFKVNTSVDWTMVDVNPEGSDQWMPVFVAIPEATNWAAAEESPIPF